MKAGKHKTEKNRFDPTQSDIRQGEGVPQGIGQSGQHVDRDKEKKDVTNPSNVDPSQRPEDNEVVEEDEGMIGQGEGGFERNRRSA